MSHHDSLLLLLFFSFFSVKNENCDAEIIPTYNESHHNRIICPNNCNVMFRPYASALVHVCFSSWSSPPELILPAAVQAEEVGAVLQGVLRPHAAGPAGDPRHRVRQHV